MHIVLSMSCTVSDEKDNKTSKKIKNEQADSVHFYNKIERKNSLLGMGGRCKFSRLLHIAAFIPKKMCVRVAGRGELTCTLPT